MEEIFKRVSFTLEVKTPYTTSLNISNDNIYVYFYEGEEIVYLINLSSLYKATLVLDTRYLVNICLEVLKSRGLI